ncbi:MAG: diaminopimelate decarboxylase [Oscillospiraceae bacterium]|nr:diaminopimelate decarboxylase [Oscillospiraceae bacterium]
MKTPFVTLDQVQEIVNTHPTPFHLYHEQAIRDNVRALQATFAWNPGFKEYFAVKATPTPGILRILQEEGCGLDCASLAELLLAERMGIVGDEIMFSSNMTPAEEYEKAMELGAIINLDDISHVDFLQDLCGIPAKISCRYNPGGVFALDNEIMDSPGDAKYGMTKEQLVEAYKKLMSYGATEFGIHAFLASNTIADEYYPELAAILFELAVDVQQKTGAKIAFINLSGGIGIPYRPEEQGADIAAIGKGVQEAYNRILVPAGMGDVAIYTELGRFMLGPYGCLVGRVLHKKDIYKQYVGLDACAVDLMRPAMYGAYHHITVLGKESAPLDHVYDVAGSLCENNDKFAIDRPLPEIAIGDYVVIHDTGAHGHAMGYNYNGKLRSAELLQTADGQVKLLRRAETPEDYFATMIF